VALTGDQCTVLSAKMIQSGWGVGMFHTEAILVLKSLQSEA